MATPLTTEQNEALRRAAWLDLQQERYLGVPQPAAIGNLSEELAARAPRTTPPDPTGGQRALPPVRPRYLQYQFDSFAGVGATQDRFSFTVSRPLYLQEIGLNVANGDANNSHIHILIRRGVDETAGLTDDDFDIWSFPTPVAGVGGIIPASTSMGVGHWSMNTTLLDTPFKFHTRAINVGGATALHFGITFWCRLIEAEELEDFSPSPLIRSAIFGEPRPHLPAPRRRLAPGAEPPNPGVMQVCSLGFCRNVPYAFLDPALKREYVVNTLSGRPTPGMRPVSAAEIQRTVTTSP